VAGWLGVCHTPVLYQNGKPILKLFLPSGSPIILVSCFLLTHAPIHNSKGNPFSGGVKYTGSWKIGDFRWKSPFISKTVRDKPMVTMER